MSLSKDRAEDLRKQTIALILELRAAYLKAGGNTLDHWDQLLTRCRRAASQSVGVESWFSLISRGMRLGAPGSSLSSELQSLIALVAADANDWLRMLEDETPALMARCRHLAEQRRASRDAMESGDASTNDPDELREAADAAASEKPNTTKTKRKARP